MLAFGLDFLKPEWWFDKAGSAALAVVTAIIFAESGLLFGFFLPGDSLLFFTGFLTSSAAKEEAPFAEFAQHLPALPFVLIFLTAAAIAGDQVGYLFGR
jgi:membrane-associated protein